MINGKEKTELAPYSLNLSFVNALGEAQDRIGVELAEQISAILA